MLIRKLFRTAIQYKSQFISMLLMITLGIGVFLGFQIEWHSIEADTSQFFSQTNYADYRVYSESGFSAADLAAIQSIEGVEAATRYLSVNVGIQNTAKTLTLNVSENYQVSTMLITDGAAYDPAVRGIWLSDRFAAANGIAIGDELCLVYQGRELSGAVVGLCKSGENMICVADTNQLMPDFTAHGFAYITPEMLEESLGVAFYPQVNLLSQLPKAELEAAVRHALGRTMQVVEKELHTAYAGAQSESEEGKTMGAILPVLFLAIAILTMVTTMHRIAANEKVQIGTLKALGFRDRRILRHYTAYGLAIGVVGCGLGTALGYGIAAFIISPNGMMATYFDLPDWKLTMPAFCIPIILLTVVLLTGISFLSARKMLKGTAAEALRPYTPKPMKRAAIERFRFWDRMSFSVKWNVRDVLRHKTRSAMTLFGVFGCMLLMVGGLGMQDTMEGFLETLDNDVNHYATKLTLSETADNAAGRALCDAVDGSWQASVGISYRGDATTLDIYSADNDKICFFTEDGQQIQLSDDGVYLCLRLKDTAKIGDIIEISPYGSEETYRVAVAGYFRSLFSECIAMSEGCAASLGLPYHISAVYTNQPSAQIESSALISGKQEKAKILESYDTFLELMNLMVAVLIAAAAVLGVVVLYNLGVMSYVERRRELATLKVLGFRDRAIGRLLIGQNLWLTGLGVLLGLPGGVGVLKILLLTLAREYELELTLRLRTYVGSVLLTFGVALLVSKMLSRKNRRIDMVEALKGAE